MPIDWNGAICSWLAASFCATFTYLANFIVLLAGSYYYTDTFLCIQRAGTTEWFLGWRMLAFWANSALTLLIGMNTIWSGPNARRCFTLFGLILWLMSTWPWDPRANPDGAIDVFCILLCSNFLVFGSSVLE